MADAASCAARRRARWRPGVPPLGLFLGALAAAAWGQPVRILDLLSIGTPAGEITRIHGSSLNADGETPTSGAAGVPVAGGWDLDGDGFPDSAFSSVRAGPAGRDGAGEVLVKFGDGMLGGSATTALFEPTVLKIIGEHDCEVAGVEIEIADVTGDGTGDLLIGRQNHSPALRPGAGALTILTGGQALRDHAAALVALDLGDIPLTIPATTFIGGASYDRFGVWMRTGDVDGDGILDIAVGADQVDKTVGMTLEDERGAAFVIRGGAHLAVTQIVDLAVFGTMAFPMALQEHVARLEPPAGSNNYHLGATVQIGDLDDDGKGEVLAAAALNRSNAGIGLAANCGSGGTAESTGGAPNGEVFIAWDESFPASPWANGYTIDLTGPSANLTRLRGSPDAPDNNELGEEMLAGLDYDGNGEPDLFLGDLTGNPDGFMGIGSRSVAGLGHVLFNVELLRGVSIDLDDLIAMPPPGLRHTLVVGPASPAIGADTAVHGDYDGDGLADLAMCNPIDSPQGRVSAGTVHVVYGEIGGWPSVIDLAPAGLPSPESVRVVEIRGAFGNAAGDGADTLCYSAAGGDMDEDGVPDLLINEMKGNGFAQIDPDPDLEPAVDVGNLLLIGGAQLLEKVLLDIDGDGDAEAMSDGVLFARFLLEFRGDALLAGAVDSGATRDGPEIETYLARIGAALDVDANDDLSAFTDGVIVLRYLVDPDDPDLLDDALGLGAQRITPTTVKAFLDRLQPPP